MRLMQIGRGRPSAPFIALLLALVTWAPASAQTKATAPAAQPPAFPQRAVLYEEDRSHPTGHQYAGSVVWRIEQLDDRPGESAVHADIDIPDRKLTVTMRLRRNLDPALAAGHIVELSFAAPPELGGGIGDVRGMLVKPGPDMRGMPLAGATWKIAEGAFRINLSNVDAERQRNLQFIRDGAWFSLAIVLADQRRAILAFEKGGSGEEAVNTASAAW